MGHPLPDEHPGAGGEAKCWALDAAPGSANSAGGAGGEEEPLITCVGSAATFWNSTTVTSVESLPMKSPLPFISFYFLLPKYGPSPCTPANKTKHLLTCQGSQLGKDR